LQFFYKMQTIAQIGAQCPFSIPQKDFKNSRFTQKMRGTSSRHDSTSSLSLSSLHHQHQHCRKCTVVASSSASSASPSTAPASLTANRETNNETEIRPGVFEGFWLWDGHKIRYHRTANTDTLLPPVLCIHGFGGNADHWRKNLPDLSSTCNAYAIDLLGYGFSDKPDPRNFPINTIYNFSNWGRQIRDFIKEKIGQPTILTCNSVGGLAGLQAAIDEPELIPAVQVINISLRMLHESKQAPLAKPLVAALQKTLRTTSLGKVFFAQVATANGVKNVLKQCYCNTEAVTDELVECILKPGLEPGAVDVFLDFISYSGGPLPETLIRECPVPVSVVWGQEDPWEKLEWGRAFATYPSVEEFIELPGVGHCPQDEAPHLVNPLIKEWVARHSAV
jgi:pimeloyl-ACP methyl ester carboxylesterase